ncbi:hypothetical protein J5N97_020297 [Dioscorea zingiberensis]|uniref:Uncharacterized protein n=1 Tax=Dioscorea zingiberensis TaxID=325984 RepID=A0A9D5CGT6_9LILI|nr:hypothetical protein J5N97_020297 [Dioscorea zingiberensis]
MRASNERDYHQCSIQRAVDFCKSELMGHQESLEFYLNLSRKELQGLCKKYNLPANRSHAQLAKSLVSHFKSKTDSCILPKEQSSSIKGKNNIPIKNTKGVIESRNEYPESADWRHSSVGIQVDRSGTMETQNSQKVYNSDPHFAHPCPSTNERAEDFSSSACLRSSVAANIQDVTGIVQHGYECHDYNRNESQKSINPKNPPQRLIDFTNYKTGNSTTVSTKRKGVSECSKDGGFVDSVVTKKAAPSFEFFAMSDEGINLLVDLKSSPSDWINSLKNNICIYQESQQSKPRTLCDHLRGLLDADDPLKNSSGNVGMYCQRGGVEKNSGCSNSSLSSVVSENCHTDAYQIDATVITSRSSLTLSCIPVETSGCLGGNQMVAASCTTHSGAPNNLTNNVSFCSRNKDLMLQDPVGVACGMAKSNKSAIDPSVKPAEMADILSPDGRMIENTLEPQALKMISVGSDNAKVNYVDKESGVCEKQSPPKYSTHQDNLDKSSIDNLKYHAGASQVSVDGVGPEGLSEALGLNKSSSESDSCQINEQLLDHSMTDAQSDVGSFDNIPNGRPCCSLGPSAIEVPVSAIDDELDTSIPGREKQSSECSQFPGFLLKNGKRPHSLKTLEGLQRDLQGLFLRSNLKCNQLKLTT